MAKTKIGVLCPSEIAFRRFMPALIKNEKFEFVGIAYANEEEWYGSGGNNDLTVIDNECKKANEFINAYGGRVFNSYSELLTSKEVDAVYIPLPPALHHKWAKRALLEDKHVLLEKPFTTTLEDTNELLAIAETHGLAVHENYMFQYHSQLEYIKDVIASKKIGDLRLIRIGFGFPFRGVNDFRYNKSLGGGALLDCGGYTIKLASMFLGEDATVVTSMINYDDKYDVDLYGSATIVNKQGLTAQISFGMDNSYKCELELWGSKGTLYTDRILTAPEGFSPTIKFKVGNDETVEELVADDTFAKSIVAFDNCIENEQERKINYEKIRKQGFLVNQFIEGAKKC
jgi:hypothetical protein